MNQSAYDILTVDCKPFIMSLLKPMETYESEPGFESRLAFKDHFYNCLLAVAKKIAPLCPQELDSTACVVKFISKYFSSFKETYSEVSALSFAKYIVKIPTDILSHYPDCTVTYCPDLDKNAVHPRALDAAKIITRAEHSSFLNFNYIPPEWTQEQEALRFRYDDIREKLLVVAAKSDHNNALKPELISGILSKLATIYDTKYSVIEDYSQLCSLIASAKNVGGLTHLIIMGHGNPELIVLNSKENLHAYEDFDLIDRQDFSCLSNIAPHGKISLFSCSTGKPNEDGHPLKNIAQRIADKTKRVVVAPKDLLYPVFTSLLNPDKNVFFHPENRLGYFLPFYNYNLFKTFHPNFQKCTSIDSQSLHERELRASKEIYQNLMDNFLISDSPFKTEKDYLQFCEEDPREKFLFLSTLNDNSAFSSPSNSIELLAGLESRFDLKYKVVKTYDEICAQISEARQSGVLKGVILQSKSEENQPALLNSNPAKDEHLNTTSNVNKLSKCMSQIDERGAFAFLGGSIGTIQPHEARGMLSSLNPFKNKYSSLAEQLAALSKRTVLAPLCKVFANDVHLRSTDPLIIDSPAYSFINKYIFSCHSNETNLFQEFNP